MITVTRVGELALGRALMLGTELRVGPDLIRVGVPHQDLKDHRHSGEITINSIPLKLRVMAAMVSVICFLCFSIFYFVLHIWIMVESWILCKYYQCDYNLLNTFIFHMLVNLRFSENFLIHHFFELCWIECVNLSVAYLLIFE